MPEQKEGARPLQRPNAQPPRGAINSVDDTSIVRYTRSAVKALTVTTSAATWALLAATWRCQPPGPSAATGAASAASGC